MIARVPSGTSSVPVDQAQLERMTDEAGALLTRLKKKLPETTEACDRMLARVTNWQALLTAEQQRPQGYRDQPTSNPALIAHLEKALDALKALLTTRRNDVSRYSIDISKLGESRAGRALRSRVASHMALATPLLTLTGGGVATILQLGSHALALGAVGGALFSAALGVSALRYGVKEAKSLRDVGLSNFGYLSAAEASLRSAAAAGTETR